MNCCVNCFHDAHIRATIEKYNTKGNCDFCSSKGIPVYDVSITPNPIAEMLMSILQIYSVSDSQDAKPLKVALRDDWDIFNAGAELILTLTKQLCASMCVGIFDIFSKNVIIPQLMDSDFLREYCVVRGYSWEEFSNSIKYKNRFHSGIFNTEAFTSFMTYITRVYPVGSRFYRARISKERTGFAEKDMGAPPKNLRNGGRVNPEGIGVLYLSSDAKTVLNEVRAIAFDYITIGEFQSTRDIKVVNLSDVTHTSPFIYDGELEQFAANRKVFQVIAAEIAKPLRRNDSPLEYLPTQYIAEYIKSENYDGVEYASTLRQGGYNLAIFDEKLFSCINVQTIEVSEVLYSTQPQLPD